MIKEYLGRRVRSLQSWARHIAMAVDPMVMAVKMEKCEWS
jgi:hypothetical protein